MLYSDEDIEAAKQLVRDLESFSNRDISHIANLSKVTDNSRSLVIAELLVREFGVAILNKNIFNPFGADTLTKKISYRNDVSTKQSEPQSQA
jgi:hypothetical protein